MIWVRALAFVSVMAGMALLPVVDDGNGKTCRQVQRACRPPFTFIQLPDQNWPEDRRDTMVARESGVRCVCRR